MFGGTIDAAVVTDPFLSRIISTKIGDLVSYYMLDALPEGTMGVGFASTAAWAAANPGLVKAFREAIAEGAALAERPGAGTHGHWKIRPRLTRNPRDHADIQTRSGCHRKPDRSLDQHASPASMVKPGLAAAGALAK